MAARVLSGYLTPEQLSALGLTEGDIVVPECFSKSSCGQDAIQFLSQYPIHNPKVQYYGGDYVISVEECGGRIKVRRKLGLAIKIFLGFSPGFVSFSDLIVSGFSKQLGLGFVPGLPKLTFNVPGINEQLVIGFEPGLVSLSDLIITGFSSNLQVLFNPGDVASPAPGFSNQIDLMFDPGDAYVSSVTIPGLDLTLTTSFDPGLVVLENILVLGIDEYLDLSFVPGVVVPQDLPGLDLTLQIGFEPGSVTLTGLSAPASDFEIQIGFEPGPVVLSLTPIDGLGEFLNLTFEPGDTYTIVPFISADYYVIEYNFGTPGEDLDTRTYIQDPNSNLFLGPLGWCKDELVFVEGEFILVWGGDNVDTGAEAVLFDRLAYEAVFGTEQTKFVLSLNAFWYDLLGDSVTIKVTGYVGGEMIPDMFSWVNPTADLTYADPGAYTTTQVLTNLDDCIDGDFLTYLEIDYASGNIVFKQTLT